MTVVAIRPACLADAEAIAAVHVVAWRETYTGLMPQAVIDARTLDKRIERWHAILGAGADGDAIHVAEVAAGDAAEIAAGDAAGDGTAGMAARTIVGFSGTGRPRSVGAFADAELTGLYLLAARHGRGIGRALLAAAVAAARARGGRRLGLWVLTDNSRARRFYEAASAVAAATRDEILDGAPIAEIGYRLDL
jgi:ribosomal protein S18 acetylase RimI-like enzyme